MQQRLLDLVACPDCSGRLELTRRPGSNGPIESGRLTCARCGREYPITDGVPRLLPSTEAPSDEAATADHFHLEFTAEAAEGRDFDPPEVLEYIFFTRTGLDPLIYERMPLGDYPLEVPRSYRPDGTRLAGAVVLDAGCGGGRFIPVAANHADYVVGLDIGEHVDRARNHTAALTNVDFVQGSVLRPPFRQQVFDYAYAIGVLHHTEDPPAAAAALAALIGEGGSMSVWVYPPSYWGRGPRRLAGKAVHAWLRRKAPEKALRSVERWLYPLGRLQERLAARGVLKWLAAPVFVLGVPRHPVREVMLMTIMDNFATPVIHTHSDEEVRGWLEAGGFAELRRLPIATSWLGSKRIAPELRTAPRGG